MITLYDLAGDHKYHKTTIAALTGSKLDAAMLVVSATAGIGPVATELLTLVAALGIKVVTVVSKTDLCSEAALQQTLTQISATFGTLNLGRVEIVDGMHAGSLAAAAAAAAAADEADTMPVILTSSVTGRVSINGSCCDQHRAVLYGAMGTLRGPNSPFFAGVFGCFFAPCQPRGCDRRILRRSGACSARPHLTRASTPTTTSSVTVRSSSRSRRRFR